MLARALKNSLLAASALAGAWAQAIAADGPDLVFDSSIGVMNGLAQEFVYNPDGSVLSRLDWRMDNIVMFQGGVAIQFTPRARAGLRGAFNLTGASNMDDYDFDLLGCPPAPGGGLLCHSSHPETRLRQAWMVDLYGEYDVVHRDDFSLSLIGGIKRDFYQWAAINGEANYSTLPLGIGISYEQSWTAPYVGVGFSAKRGNATFTGRLTGSLWASGYDIDDHHLTTAVFSEDYSGAAFVSADLGYKQQLRQGMALSVGYRFQKWGTAKGPTYIYDRIAGAEYFIPGDAAGASAVSHTFSLGLSISTDGIGAPVNEEGDGTGWSGIYAGLSAGVRKASHDFETLEVASGTWPVNPNTSLLTLPTFGQEVSAFAGWQSQNAGLRWGVEADIGRSNASGWAYGIPGTGSFSFLDASLDVTTIMHGFDGSLRARVGMDIGPSLHAYATGGLAFGVLDVELSCPGSFQSWCISDNIESASKTMVGWTAGVGADWDLGNKWFTRAEYRYTDLGSFEHNFFDDVSFDAVEAKISNRSHRLNFGLGYRF